MVFGNTPSEEVQVSDEIRSIIKDHRLSLFSFMKDVRSLDDVATRSLRIENQCGRHEGNLKPFSGIDLENEHLIEQLAEWRSAHQYAFPTRFQVTNMSTRNWLEKAVLRNQNRLLFLVLDKHQQPVGHLGLLIDEDGEIEVDNVVRGTAHFPGLMARAMMALETWALKELDAQELVLRVLESNPRAIRFYEALGYVHQESIPMKWEKDALNERLVVTAGAADDHFKIMSKNLCKAAKASKEILTAGPLIGVREATYALDAARNGWNANHSCYLKEFEAQFASFNASAFAMATSSCTAALHLSLLALGIGPGDEVIVPETTWVATGSAVRYVGATPVFADVDPVSWTIRVDEIERLVTADTKAVIPVHLYGYPADMPAIMAIAEKYDLFVVEDAAPAVGAIIDGKKVGTFGDMAAFSFQGAKMLVTGEGGMLVSNNRALMDKAWKQQDHGRVPGTFWIDEVGRKFKMSNITAAVGLAQLESIDIQIEKKRRINEWYRDFLGDIAGIDFQSEVPGSQSICWMTSIVIQPELLPRDVLAQRLKDQRVDSRPVFPPMSQFPIWENPDRYPSIEAGMIASQIGQNGLNLPSGVNLSRASVEGVSKIIKDAIAT